MDSARIRILNKGSLAKGPVVYWMSRDQRIHDNWALLFAQQQVIEYQENLFVVFTLTPAFLNATWRKYAFMMKGLQEVEANGRMGEGVNCQDRGVAMVAGLCGNKILDLLFSDERINKALKGLTCNSAGENQIIGQ